MAITTRGFGIDVMPQVYQASPDNLTLNPNRLTQGALDAFQLNDTYNKLQAFKLQQQELNANRAARINAERARLGFSSLSDDAKSSLIADQTELEKKNLATSLNVQPKEALLREGGLDLRLLALDADKQAQPFLNKSKLTKAMSDADIADLLASFDQMSAADKVNNFTGDMALIRNTKTAGISETLAKAAQANAMAGDIADRARRADDATAVKRAIAEARAQELKAKRENVDVKLKALAQREDALTKQLTGFSLPKFTIMPDSKLPVSLNEVEQAGFRYSPQTGSVSKPPSSIFGVKLGSGSELPSGSAALFAQRERIQQELDQVIKLKAALSKQQYEDESKGDEDFSAYEGKSLKGPDGNTYLIKNGVPVLVK